MHQIFHMNSFIPKGKKSPADYTFFHGLKAPIGDEKDKNHVCTGRCGRVMADNIAYAKFRKTLLI